MLSSWKPTVFEREVRLRRGANRAVDKARQAKDRCRIYKGLGLPRQRLVFQDAAFPPWLYSSNCVAGAKARLPRPCRRLVPIARMTASCSRWLNGLDQHIRYSRPSRRLAYFLTAMGHYHDETRRVGHPKRAGRHCSLSSIHFRHLPLEKNNILTCLRRRVPNGDDCVRSGRCGGSVERHRCQHRSRALADHTWTDGTQHSQDVVLQLPAQVFIFFQKCWGGSRLLAQFVTGHSGFTVSFEQIGYRNEVCVGNLFPMSWQAHHHPGSTDLLEVHFTPPKGKAERSLLEHDFISKLPGYFACPTHISNRRAPSPR